MRDYDKSLAKSVVAENKAAVEAELEKIYADIFFGNRGNFVSSKIDRSSLFEYSGIFTKYAVQCADYCCGC